MIAFGSDKGKRLRKKRVMETAGVTSASMCLCEDGRASGFVGTTMLL